MANRLPLVRLSVLRPMVQGLEEAGLDPEDIAAGAGLSVDAINDDQAVAHVMKIHSFLEDCARATKDPMFCARIGSRLNPAGWPMIAEAKQRARSLGDFLNIYVNGAPKLAASVDVFLEVRGPTATFGQSRRFPPEITPSQNDAFMVSLKLSMLKYFLGPRLLPGRVMIVLSDPSAVPLEAEGYQVLRGDRNGVRIQFPSEWLALPLDATISAVEVDTDPAVATLEASFRSLLLQNVGNGGLNAAQAAQLVHMTPRKLASYLSARSTSIGAEVLEAKMEYAREKLTGSTLSIDEISSHLGYTDPSNFSRAFSRKTGVAPSLYRREHSDGQRDEDRV